jgi:hypothetical protein
MINKEIKELRMKIEIKGLRIWKNSDKRTKQKLKTKCKINPAE